MKKRVMVVEDDPVLTRVLRDNLAFEGFDVRCVADGSVADAAVKEFSPDLVLLDVNLPGKSGLGPASRDGVRDHGPRSFF